MSPQTKRDTTWIEHDGKLTHQNVSRLPAVPVSDKTGMNYVWWQQGAYEHEV